MLSNVPEREQTNLNKVVAETPSKVGRIPIKLTGTDIEGNDVELSFHMEGDPMLIDQTRINLNKCKATQNKPK